MRRSFGQHIEQSHRDRHIQLAVIGAVVVGGANLVSGVMGSMAGVPGAWIAIVAGAIFLVLAFGVYRRSLAAAVTLLVLFVLSRFLVGVMNGFIWTAVLTYIFARAANELRAPRAAAVPAPPVAR
jgi:MFS family permease